MKEHHVCCGAVIIHNDKILILQQAEGKHWGIPKGHVEAGETEEQTAIREVREETGLTIKIVPGFRKTITYSFTEGANLIVKNTTVFVATTEKPTCTVKQDEITQALWATPTDALKKVTFQSVHDAIQEAITFAWTKGLFAQDNLPKAESHKSCGAIVLFKGKVLLIKQERSKLWGFPKGHVEADETEEQTAVREVKEETGLDVEIIPGFREAIHYTYRERSNRVDKETVFFLAKAETAKTVPQREEVALCKWFQPHEAMEKLTFPEVKDVLKLALEVAR